MTDAVAVPVPKRPGPCIVAIEGPSGAGKTTLVREAARRFGWHRIAEAYDRLDRAPEIDFRSDRELRATERQLLTEERRRFREALRARASGRVVVADTGFLGPFTYTAGLVARGEADRRVFVDLVRSGRSMGRSWGVPDAVVYLVPRAADRRRRAGRDPGRHPPGLDPRHAAVGRFERRIYRRWSEGPLEGRVEFLRADRTPGGLAGLLRGRLAALGSVPKRNPPSLASLLRSVDELRRDSARR